MWYKNGDLAYECSNQTIDFLEYKNFSVAVLCVWAYYKVQQSAGIFGQVRERFFFSALLVVIVCQGVSDIGRHTRWYYKHTLKWCCIQGGYLQANEIALQRGCCIRSRRKRRYQKGTCHIYDPRTCAYTHPPFILHPFAFIRLQYLFIYIRPPWVLCGTLQ